MRGTRSVGRAGVLAFVGAGGVFGCTPVAEGPAAEERAAAVVARLVTQVPLDPGALPQFVDPLPMPAVVVADTDEIRLHMCELEAHVLPTGTFAPGVAPPTHVFAYVAEDDETEWQGCPAQASSTYIGPVIVAERGVPTEVRFINDLGTVSSSQVLAYTQSTDQTLHWADPANGGENSCAHHAEGGEPPMTSTNGTDCAANYDGPIPAVAHLHGGEVPARLDGGPDAWFTSDGASQGHAYYSAAGAGGNEAIYRYPNSQEAAPLWFHDHTLGATRLNVYAGLAGGYLLTDPANPPPSSLPGPAEIIPLVIQDRMFDTNGELFFPAGEGFALNPEHPFWVPEFMGDVIVVNGKAWPYLTVEPRRYRFLFLNGSNARTYELRLGGAAMWQIGTDGGYLDTPVALPGALLLMPGERADVIIDFGGVAAGTRLLLHNTAKTPFPAGMAPNGGTTGRVLAFDVACPGQGCPSADASYDPNPAKGGGAPLRTGEHAIRRLVDPLLGRLADGVSVSKTRLVTLNEVMGPPSFVDGLAYPGGPRQVILNNTTFLGESERSHGDFTAISTGGSTALYSELPREGETELWEIVNLTADAHPIHLHLVQFQLMNRQSFGVRRYGAAYDAAFPSGFYQPGFGPPLDYRAANNALSGGKDGGNPDVEPYLQARPRRPEPGEAGWKDTVIAYPGQVTRLVVRWGPTDRPIGTPPAELSYPFDPNGGHGYVWHCHIIDHEDNEMMRPTSVISNEAERSFLLGTDY